MTPADTDPDDVPGAVPEAVPEPVRRDFLTLLTVATASVGACGFAWPFLDSLNRPVADDAADEMVDVDLGRIAPGQQLITAWRGHPVFVVRRTREVLRDLQDPAVQAQLRDPRSTVTQQPVYATNWHRSIDPEYGVMIGICTHLGCVPRFRTAPDVAGSGGYICPCHGSRFDLAGRVFNGSPAQYNLPVPPYSLTRTGSLSIGASHDGTSFGLDDIVQL